MATTLMFLSCAVNVIYHDENKAAAQAVQFVKAAFVQQDSQSAYALLATRTKPYYPVEKLSEWIKKLHPSEYPRVVVAREFEPMPGQRSMNIYLYGESENEMFYYRLIMDGTAPTGYRVSGFARANGPYPSKLKCPLSEEISTTD
jgi:hypothetical protein